MVLDLISTALPGKPVIPQPVKLLHFREITIISGNLGVVCFFVPGRCGAWVLSSRFAAPMEGGVGMGGEREDREGREGGEGETDGE